MRATLSVIVLIVVIVGGVFAWRHFRSGAEPAPGAAAGGEGGGGGPPGGMQLSVEAVTVQAEPLGGGVSTVGTLRADESVVVKPEVPGRVVKIHFAEGQRVDAGAPLFSLDAQVARAALREAEATLDNARKTSTRSTELAGGALISRAELETSQSQLSVAEARLASARAQLQKLTLTAPFGGVVGLREVSVGAFITAGQSLVNLVRLDPMEVDFSLPERELGTVKAGQAIEVTLDAFPGEKFAGKVEAIDPMMDVNSRSAKVRATIANPDMRLRPGLFARIAMGSDGEGAEATALMVPEQALLQQGDTRFVYTIVDGKAKRTEVKTGQRRPGKLEIVSGLKVGDQVITAGQGKPMMHEGMPVMVLPAGPPPGGAAAGGAPGVPQAGAAPEAGKPTSAGKPTRACKPTSAARPAETAAEPADSATRSN